MSKNKDDWFRKLFINEAKAAVDARKSQTSGEKEIIATVENNVLVVKHK